MSVTIDGELGTITKNSSTIDIEKGIIVPSGNTLQRPQNPIAGMIRFNIDLAKIEGYDGTNWANIES